MITSAALRISLQSSGVLGKFPKKEGGCGGFTLYSLGILHVPQSSITIRSQFVSGFEGISAAPKRPERKWDAQVSSAPPPESGKGMSFLSKF